MSRRPLVSRHLTSPRTTLGRVASTRGPGKALVCAMHRWSTPRRDSCTQLASPDPAYRSLAAAAFRLLGYIAKRSLRWQCMAYAICQRLLSCNGRAESKVPSGLVAFGRALGRIGSFSAGELCGWLNEAIRRVYSTLLPPPTQWECPSGSKSISRGRWRIHVSRTALQPWCKSRSAGASGSRSTQRLHQL